MNSTRKIILIFFTFTILTSLAFGEWVEIDKKTTFAKDRESIFNVLMSQKLTWVGEREINRMVAGYKLRKVTEIETTVTKFKWNGSYNSCSPEDERQFSSILSGSLRYRKGPIDVLPVGPVIGVPYDWDPCGSIGSPMPVPSIKPAKINVRVK